MDQIFVAPTFLAAVTQVTAIKAGRYGSEGRRVLLTTNNSQTPEVSSGLNATPGFETLGRYFDQVLHLNDLIFPHHPFGWEARAESELLVVRQAILDATGLPPDVGLTLQSAAVPPSSTLIRAFSESRITVISDGLMSYGPSRRALGPASATRLTALLYLDMVPSLEPLLFSEHGIAKVVLPTVTFREVLAEFATRHPAHDTLTQLSGRIDALIVGQYLSQIGVLSVEEEAELYATMVESAAQLGHRRIVFKPHPSAPKTFTNALLNAANDHDVDVQLLDLPVPVEALYSSAPPKLVVGSFSTSLATASLFGIETASVGTELMASRFASFQDSNRIPVAIAAATSRRIISRDGRAMVVEAIDVDTSDFVGALAAAMQPKRFPQLRRETMEFAEAAARNPELRPFFDHPPGASGSPWTRVGIPAPIARLIPNSWFAPLRRFALRRLRGALRPISHARLSQGIRLPELTPADFVRRS
jgi:hypothetical protein